MRGRGAVPSASPVDSGRPSKGSSPHSRMRFSMIQLRSLHTIGVFLLAGTAAHAQSTWYVDDDGTAPGVGTQQNPYTSIQYAVQQPSTADGDTLLVRPGTYVENVDNLGKDLIFLSSAGAAVTTIDGNSADTVLRLDAGAFGFGTVVRGFTIRNGAAGGPSGRGGGILATNNALVTIEDCVIEDNVATLGGGIALHNVGPVLIRNTRIENNRADQGAGSSWGNGGGIHAESAFGISIVSSDIIAGWSGGSGGGLYCIDSDISLVDCSITGCRAWDTGGPTPSSGGGLFARELTQGTQLDLHRCTVRDNMAVGAIADGGGVAYHNARGTISECSITANIAGGQVPGITEGRGGGISVLPGISIFSSPVNILDTRFEDNSGTGVGGAIYASPTLNAGHLAVVGCTILGNYSERGAGIYAERKQVSVDSSHITGNRGFVGAFTLEGLGVYGPAVLQHCELDGHHGAVHGGAAYGAELLDCYIHDNTVSAPGKNTVSRGAGAYQCHLERCLVSGNLAWGGFELGNNALGGGLHGCTALDCTILGNQAKTSVGLSEGGGAWGCTLRGCVLVQNLADLGAGTYLGVVDHCTVISNQGNGVEAATSVHDSILRDNTGSNVLASTSVGYCNIGGGFSGVGIIDAPELFVDPVGGPDGTGVDVHFASANSPGIDAGDPSSPPDPDGSPTDLGAHPWDPTWTQEPAAYCLGSVSGDGCLGRVAWSGTPSLSGPDDFWISVDDVSAQRLGIFFWGLAPAAIPFQGGTLCVAPPIQRTPVASTGGQQGPNPCLGMMEHAFPQAALTAAGFTPGTRGFGQFWIRDPLSSSGSALSNASWWTTAP